MYAFNIYIDKSYAILSFCETETYRLETFILDDTGNDYNKFSRFFYKEIYNREKGTQKNLLIGWDNHNNKNSILYNVLKNKSLVYYNTINDYDGDTTLYIADLYKILNLKHKYKYEPLTTLRYLLMINNIALVDKYYKSKAELIEINNELTTGIAILSKMYNDEITFSYKYSKHYDDKNVIMSPLRASLKKISLSLLGSADNIKSKMSSLPTFSKVYGSNLDLKPIEIEDKKYIDTIKTTEFIKGQSEDIYFYNIANTNIKCTKVGLSYSVKNYYSDDQINDIYYIDIKSFYSTILINNKFVPEIFRDKTDEYINYIQKIVKLKNDNPNDYIYKQILTSIVGLMLKDGILKDPITFYNITINGILYMINMIEHIYKNMPSIKILNVKTDGIIFSINKNNGELLNKIIKDWEDKNKFYIKVLKIKKIFIYDLNNRIMVYYSNEKYEYDYNYIRENYHSLMSKNIDGYNDGDTSYGIIANGFWDIKNNTKNLPQIIKISLFYNFIFNISILDIIVNNNDNIYMYALNNYNENTFELVYIENDTIKPKIYNNDMIKYFVSNNKNDYIIKVKDSKTKLVDNNYLSLDFSDKKKNDIKYSWYVQKTNNILTAIPKSLFD